ncbi:hypothetical protein [Zoogloea sp.]|jgi:serine acetyltransferase|uniref:hypothetical protein n=1 Tax=Zoogloea sp. TaxID=49181 RepID=UPI0035B45726
MKAKLSDFFYSAVALAVIFLTALAVVGWGLSPWVKVLVGDYFVVVNPLLFLLVYGVVSGVMMQILLKFKPLELGEFSMDSPVFSYWMLLTVIHKLAQGALRPFTSVFTEPLFIRLFGARVGGNVALGGVIGEPFLVQIDDDVVLGYGSLIAGSIIADGKIILGRVHVRKGATVGVYAVAMGSIDIGENAKLVGGATLLPGSKIPAGEVWRGSPARKWISPAAATPKPES